MTQLSDLWPKCVVSLRKCTVSRLVKNFEGVFGLAQTVHSLSEQHFGQGFDNSVLYICAEIPVHQKP